MTRIPYSSIEAIGSQIGDLITGHFDLAFRRVMRGPRVENEHGFIRLITGEEHPFANFACITHPVDEGGTAVAVQPLIDCQSPAAIFLAGQVPDEVNTQLELAGFEAHKGMPAMAIEIEQLPPLELPSGYTFARVESGVTQRDLWAEAFALGYELPHSVGVVFSGGIDPDQNPDLDEQQGDEPTVHYYWITKDGKPVCTSLLYLQGGVAGIYAVATLPDERGQGLGAYITAEPLRIAHSMGYRVGVLQASEDGEPVYQRMGFADFGELPLYVRMPTSD